MDTFPRRTIKTLNEFISKHKIFLPVIIPDGEDKDDYSFDWNSADFHGPFKRDRGFPMLSVEQQDPSLPLFRIDWQPNGHDGLQIFFFKASVLDSMQYCLTIEPFFISFFDNSNPPVCMHKYKLNSSGGLAEKLC